MSENQAANAEVKTESKINEAVNLAELPQREGYNWTSKDLNPRSTKKLDENGEPVLDEKGNPVTEKGPSVRIPMLIPSAATLAALIASDEKIADMVVGLVTAEVYANAKAQVEDLVANKVVPTLDQFDYDKLELHEVAVEYASTGRKGIADEQYDSFLLDIGVYWQEENTEEKKIKSRQDVFKRKFAQVKGNKQICAGLRALLAQFVTDRPEVAASHADVVKAYDSLLERYVNAQEKDLTAALL